MRKIYGSIMWYRLRLSTLTWCELMTCGHRRSRQCPTKADITWSNCRSSSWRSRPKRFFWPGWYIIESKPPFPVSLRGPSTITKSAESRTSPPPPNTYLINFWLALLHDIIFIWNGRQCHLGIIFQELRLNDIDAVSETEGAVMDWFRVRVEEVTFYGEHDMRYFDVMQRERLAECTEPFWFG